MDIETDRNHGTLISINIKVPWIDIETETQKHRDTERERDIVYIALYYNEVDNTDRMSIQLFLANPLPSCGCGCYIERIRFLKKKNYSRGPDPISKENFEYGSSHTLPGCGSGTKIGWIRF